MIKYYNVQGTQVTVPSIEVNVDTVYIRKNIHRITTENFIGWQYDEIQYDLSEYLEFVGTTTSTLEIETADLWYQIITGGAV